MNNVYSKIKTIVKNKICTWKGDFPAIQPVLSMAINGGKAKIPPY